MMSFIYRFILPVDIGKPSFIDFFILVVSLLSIFFMTIILGRKYRSSKEKFTNRNIGLIDKLKFESEKITEYLKVTNQYDINRVEYLINNYELKISEYIALKNSLLNLPNTIIIATISFLTSWCMDYIVNIYDKELLSSLILSPYYVRNLVIIVMLILLPIFFIHKFSNYLKSDFQAMKDIKSKYDEVVLIEYLEQIRLDLL
jgi:hypothetical protein